MNRPIALFLSFLLAGCASEAPPTPPVDSAPVVMAPDDSLVLLLPDSGRVWLTTGRVGTASDGGSCREYGVRLDVAGAPRLVPLLYVRTPPRLEGGRLFATLSSNCAPGATYEIDRVTAQPKLVTGAGR
jgi:hypothetical protein